MIHKFFYFYNNIFIIFLLYFPWVIKRIDLVLVFGGNNLLIFLKHFLSLLCIMGPSFYFGFNKQPAEMGLALAAGVLCVVFLNLDKFQSFSAGADGIQAELRKAVEEAYATVEELRELAKSFVSITFINLTYDKRFGGMDEEETVIYRNQIEGLINSLNIEEDPIVKRSVEKYYNFITWDYYRDFCNSDYFNNQGSKEFFLELGSLRKYGTYDFPSKAEILSICEKHNVKLNSELISLLDEFEKKYSKQLKSH